MSVIVCCSYCSPWKTCMLTSYKPSHINHIIVICITKLSQSVWYNVQHRQADSQTLFLHQYTVYGQYAVFNSCGLRRFSFPEKTVVDVINFKPQHWIVQTIFKAVKLTLNAYRGLSRKSIFLKMGNLKRVELHCLTRLKEFGSYRITEKNWLLFPLDIEIFKLIYMVKNTSRLPGL